MQDLVILGFTQYKDKILNDGKRIDKDKTMDGMGYAFITERIEWGDDNADVSECWVLKELSGKSQMQLIFNAPLFGMVNFCEKRKEVIIEYNPADEEVALKQILIMLFSNPMYGLDVSDIYEMISPKVKFLSYEIEKSDESGYLIAAKKWIKQMALDHNLKNNLMFLVSGDDVYFVLAHKIAEIADTCLVGADKTMLLQGDPTDFVISDGIRISFWINETE